jgi:hypothetical protein
MPEIKSSFLQGKMNKDLDDRILPKGQYRDAENIKIAKSDSSNVGAAQNIKGNTIQYTTSLGLPTSTAINLNDEIFSLWDTIGYYANSQTGDVFWFVTSFAGPTSDNVLDHKPASDVVVAGSDVNHDDDTTGHRSIQISNASNHNIQVGMLVTGTGVAADSYVQSISTTSNISTIVLNKAQSGQTVLDSVALTFAHTCRIYKINTIENTSPSIIIDNKKLNLSKNHHIHHVNQLSNLLFWTDNYNQPRRINIETTSYPDDDFFEDRISVAQVAPFAAPKVKMTKVSASTVPSLHLRDKFVKFGYRYVYENNEVSLISPFTQTCFLPGKGKNINNGSFKDGEAGVINSTESAAIQKNTVVDMMQNMVNRVRLFIDLPSDQTKDNVASADAGNTGTVLVDAHLVGAAQSNQTINSISAPSGSAAGVIDNTTTVLTERGDKYTVHSITENSNLALDSTIKFNEEIPAEHAILHGEKLYFFKPGSDTNYYQYTNPLNIKRVEIVYAESDSPAVKVVETIKIPTGQTSLDAIIKHRVDPGTDTKGKLRFGIEYVYDSSKPIKTLPEQDITRVADIVPVKAKAQEVSGNRIIYGNFKINRPITNLINNKDNISVTNRDQTRYNTQYLLHSVKQNREYSVGLVLSDKYGRQSSVFLPTSNTTFVTPKAGSPVTPFNSGVYNNANRWNGTALNIDFGATISDVYDSTTNPYGWYSYKVVVKQAQQEYDNVYVPSLIDDFPSSDKSSWVTLFGDNVNKVPRDIIDGSLDNTIASSKTKLLPKILNVDSTGIADGLLGNGHKQQNTTDFVEIIAIGEAKQFGEGTGTVSENAALVNKDRNPIVAELPDGFGGGSGPGTALCVLETDPFISALDIYFETSTAGLISDLNENIQASLGSTPNNISLTQNTFAENIAANTNIATLGYTDTNGNSPSGETYTLESVKDGSNATRTSEFQLVGDVLKTASGVNHIGHEFRNRPEDTFTFELKVTDSGGNSITQNKTVTLTNVNPTIIPTTISVDVPDNTTTGNLITTFTGSNSCGKSGSALQNGLSFSIVSGNGQGDFGITGTTGEVHATEDSWTAGDTYSLGIRVTDAGGGTADATLNITITASTVTRFYRSPGNTSQTGACSDAANQQAYHDGLGDLPSAGDKVYTNNTGTTLFNGQNAYYVASVDPVMAGEAGYNIRINSSGVVSNPTLCSG